MEPRQDSMMEDEGGLVVQASSSGSTVTIPSTATSLVDSMLEDEGEEEEAEEEDEEEEVGGGGEEGPVERLWREGAALEARRREVWSALLHWESRRPDLALFASPEWNALRPTAPSHPLHPPHPFHHPHHHAALLHHQQHQQLAHHFHNHHPPLPPHLEPLHESLINDPSPPQHVGALAMPPSHPLLLQAMPPPPPLPFAAPQHPLPPPPLGGFGALPPPPLPAHHYHHHMHHHMHGRGRWRRGGRGFGRGGRGGGFGPGGPGDGTEAAAAGRAMTRLARHTKARTLVTELAKLATQPTAEALQGVAASKQKTRGINKDQVFEVFDSLVNTQLSAPERITRSSVWKYLFRGSKTSGQTVEPLYGNEKIFKTTKKGGGVRRLTGVVWRDLDAPESRDAISESLASLEAYGVHINVEQLKELIQEELVKDSVNDAIVVDAPSMPPTAQALGAIAAGGAATTTTTTTTTTTAGSSGGVYAHGHVSHSAGQPSATSPSLMTDASLDLPSTSTSSSPTPALPYALPTNTGVHGAPAPSSYEHPLPHQPEQLQQGEEMMVEATPTTTTPALGSAEEPTTITATTGQGDGGSATVPPAMDSDLQQLLRLLTQKDTLEKLQAMVGK